MLMYNNSTSPVYQEYSMKYIYSTSQMSKLSLTLRTFSVTNSVAGLFLTLCHLYMIQTTMSQALWISQTTPYPWTTIEFHFHGLHRETSIILRIWYYLGYSRLAHQTNDLYPCPQHHHIYRLSTSICPSCVWKTQHSFPCHLWQRLRVYVKLLLIFKHCSRHVASPHFRLSSQRWWTNWMHESDTRAIPLCIL